MTESAPSTAQGGEPPTERLDRLLHAAAAPWLGNLSPISLSLAWADWAWHLGVSPGRQMELAARAAQLGIDTWRVAAGLDGERPVGAADDDPRFRDPAWTQWPFSVWREGFRNAETFWREASRLPGMTAHHADLTAFFARQWLGMLTPANFLPTNPVVLRDAIASGGAHLAKGARHWLEDVTGVRWPGTDEPAHFEVGRDVAVTPGQVVWRNRLIELIRYDAATPRVHPEPLLVIPSWIMKYYILDLSPHNSMVRWLVGQGHTVYMLSWRNPEAADRDLSMDDYLRLGVFDALRAVGRIEGAATPVHAMGYCLGGTLLAIAVAALARRERPAGTDDLPPLATMTLLAAQTDFAEPGELGLFIDESQIRLLDDIMKEQGYLSGEQMAGSFQFLHSRELVWTRRMREYLMGEREQPSDLMAWNADHTRMPARMHHEYLVSLYLRNELATNRYRVDGRPVSLNDVTLPVFAVGTQRDHVSPWRSVYQLHRLTDAEVTFVLTTGGHNAGIVSEPGHPGRRYQIATRPAHGAWTDPQAWEAEAPAVDGSWWPAWQRWLAAHSSPPRRPRPVPAAMVLGPAPGTYVFVRHRH
ncbi:poly-beta-hydroxybutyrate polymerase N-terminal domain-containing protein [Calidifontimicrobium sp. SYSU G02091]|uniref:PHA/PHB synthase family protein n=1 Tax=Calidifontimicrobium sp. SYSU G02091 TaxID=2926421 RepID=UPI001F53252D|nr:alpha/beta fold hydrolase [Calidifontimicrobium sp. SYSU G02091]MCI1190522.1 poly-beta-hydroxybutyrate polymerase N-terminal domain-containing protein [Calidifontimicrobium sp. SYSU G02091]